LEIWADGYPIARVEGRFGVADADEGLLNIKLGIYRDLQAGNAGLTVEQFSMRHDPEKAWSPAERLSSGRELQTYREALGDEIRKRNNALASSGPLSAKGNRYNW
jgi:hypothetical protein